MDRTDDASLRGATERLIEAERAYQSALAEEHVARQVRDEAIIEAHWAGLSSRAIGELFGGMDQANVVRARRRAAARRDVVPDGLLGPADALRRSGLSAAAFVAAVRQGHIRPVDAGGEVRTFHPEDVDALHNRPGDGAEVVT